MPLDVNYVKNLLVSVNAEINKHMSLQELWTLFSTTALEVAHLPDQTTPKTLYKITGTNSYHFTDPQTIPLTLKPRVDSDRCITGLHSIQYLIPKPEDPNNTDQPIPVTIRQISDFQNSVYKRNTASGAQANGRRDAFADQVIAFLSNEHPNEHPNVLEIIDTTFPSPCQKADLKKVIALFKISVSLQRYLGTLREEQGKIAAIRADIKKTKQRTDLTKPQRAEIIANKESEIADTPSAMEILKSTVETAAFHSINELNTIAPHIVIEIQRRAKRKRIALAIAGTALIVGTVVAVSIVTFGAPVIIAAALAVAALALPFAILAGAAGVAIIAGIGYGLYKLFTYLSKKREATKVLDKNAGPFNAAPAGALDGSDGTSASGTDHSNSSMRSGSPSSSVVPAPAADLTTHTSAPQSRSSTPVFNASAAAAPVGRNSVHHVDTHNI